MIKGEWRKRGIEYIFLFEVVMIFIFIFIFLKMVQAPWPEPHNFTPNSSLPFITFFPCIKRKRKEVTFTPNHHHQMGNETVSWVNTREKEGRKRVRERREKREKKKKRKRERESQKVRKKRAELPHHLFSFPTRTTLQVGSKPS